jgi:hypothetical protein
MSRKRVSEIEDAIAAGRMTAPQVFTQMRQLIPADAALSDAAPEGADPLDETRASEVRAAIKGNKYAQRAFDSLLGDLAHQRDDNRRLYRLATPTEGAAPEDGIAGVMIEAPNTDAEWTAYGHSLPPGTKLYARPAAPASGDGRPWFVDEEGHETRGHAFAFPGDTHVVPVAVAQAEIDRLAALAAQDGGAGHG